MATTLAKDLETSLNSYSVGVDYWDPYAGDTYTFLGHRQFLQAHVTDLTTAQLQRLQLSDRKVGELLAQHAGVKSDDVDELALIAMVFDSQSKKAA